MYLNLSFMPFLNPFVLSIIYQLLLLRHSLLSLSVHVISLLSFSTYMHPTFYSKRHQQIVYSYTTLISTPVTFPLLHFANAVVKLLFPSTFFTLCLLTTQINRCLHHINYSPFCNNYNYVHLHINLPFVFQLRLHFSSPSLLHHLLISAPHLLISTLIIIKLLLCNNVLIV